MPRFEIVDETGVLVRRETGPGPSRQRAWRPCWQPRLELVWKSSVGALRDELESGT